MSLACCVECILRWGVVLPMGLYGVINGIVWESMLCFCVLYYKYLNNKYFHLKVIFVFPEVNYNFFIKCAKNTSLL